MAERIERGNERLNQDPQLAELAKMKSNPDQFKELQVKAWAWMPEKLGKLINPNFPEPAPMAKKINALFK